MGRPGCGVHPCGHGQVSGWHSFCHAANALHCEADCCPFASKSQRVQAQAWPAVGTGLRYWGWFIWLEHGRRQMSAPDGAWLLQTAESSRRGPMNNHAC